nr:MAG TPA: hypothetical protein [Bacteriophage sp.]
MLSKQKYLQHYLLVMLALGRKKKLNLSILLPKLVWIV